MDMSQFRAATIFAVDDVDSAQRLLSGAFYELCDMETFGSAESCLTRLEEKQPDLFLLDVDLPGMDGYSLCREIKQKAGLSEKPVIFISALDDLDSRLEGYDAGGIDFITKPYDLNELKQKVALALKVTSDRAAIQQHMEETETLTTLILSNLDEYALLIRFLRALSTCESQSQIAEALFAMLSGFKLDSVIQLRTSDGEATLNPAGLSGPMETSVMHHVRDMGSIFEFKSRAAFNFGGISLLINNIPVDDGELCGRLRDHLAIAVESASSRLEAIEARVSKSRAASGISNLLDQMEVTVNSFSVSYDKARAEGTILTEELLSDLSASFAHLGMSEEQEERISSVVRKRAFDLADLYDFGDATQDALKKIKAELSALLALTH